MSRLLPNNLATVFPLLLTLVVITSCAGTKYRNIDLKNSTQQHKTYRIVSVDESGYEINDLNILESLRLKIISLSRYPNFYTKINNQSKKVSGFEAIILNNKDIKIQYLNGQLSRSGLPTLTEVSSIIRVQIENDTYNLYKTVTLYPPTSINISQVSGDNGYIKTLDKPIKLRADLENIYNEIDISMNRLMFLTGEFLVRNVDDEVYDNFEHKLGLYSSKYFQENGVLFGIFELKSNKRNNIIPLRIKIYPDVRGSRVRYEFDIQYTLNSNGASKFDHKEIRYLMTTIKNVATTTNLDIPINHYQVNNKNLIAIIDEPEIIYNQRQLSPTNINKRNSNKKTKTKHNQHH